MRFILLPYSLWEKGKYKKRQEDSIFPELGMAKADDRLFLLCDGIGGHLDGNIASSTVCKVMSQYIHDNSEREGSFTDNLVTEAIDKALDALDNCDPEHADDDRRMGTTMTMLKFHSQGCTLAHIGDSRIYHIRQGKDRNDTKILFMTTDHSWINDMVKLGNMTEDEAKNCKQKNIITRAMQANMEHRPKADICHIEDVRPDDYFFMCSDGMLNELEDNNLRYIFSKAVATDEERMEMLKQVSEDSHDNHSAYVIHVVDVIKDNEKKEETHVRKSYKHVWLFLFFMVLFAVIACSLFVFL
ncbi:MAG: protein phosphatase 2C domain-containing protein [Prevotella sp.]|nr:protein phosphatase 2C domain-containing protein [Prevotella sp.]